MTHTLHRLGTPENLVDDYVVLAMSAKGINEAGSAPKLRRFLEMAFAHQPINAGDMKTGNIVNTSREEILEGIQDVSIVHAVFASEQQVAAFLQDLRKADLGISVVVSGLIDGTARCAQQAKLSPHTVEYSLGIWGQTERLPDTETLQITTMCGHAMVAANLVHEMVGEVRQGRISAEEAALSLAGHCVCGIFNHQRAARLIAAMAQGD
jgi:hypothetical protein